MSKRKPITAGLGAAAAFLVITPAQKMDAAELFTAVCSCGEYTSSPGTWYDASRAGVEHYQAKHHDVG